MKKKDTKQTTEQVLESEVTKEEITLENDLNESDSVGEVSSETSETDLRIEELESTIETLKTELENAKDTLLRRTAEFENVK